MTSSPDTWVGQPYRQKRRRRRDDEYEIEALTKGINVLEALEGLSFEPVPIATIVERTGLSRDVADRSLKTLRMKGYASQIKGGKWTLGTRLLKFAERYSELCLKVLAQTKDPQPQACGNSQTRDVNQG
jgi:hypothetical protein